MQGPITEFLQQAVAKRVTFAEAKAGLLDLVLAIEKEQKAIEQQMRQTGQQAVAKAGRK